MTHVCMCTLLPSKVARGGREGDTREKRGDAGGREGPGKRIYTAASAYIQCTCSLSCTHLRKSTMQCSGYIRRVTKKVQRTAVRQRWRAFVRAILRHVGFLKLKSA